MDFLNGGIRGWSVLAHHETGCRSGESSSTQKSKLSKGQPSKWTYNEFVTCFHEFWNYESTKKIREIFHCFVFLLDRSYQNGRKINANITLYKNKTLLWQLCAAMMSWVGCLLTDWVLPGTWKLRESEWQKFWEEFGYFLQIR